MSSRSLRVLGAFRGADRTPATWLEDTVGAVVALLGVAALYWDGLRHNTKVIRDDNFWSPPHIALYAAMGVFAA